METGQNKLRTKEYHDTDRSVLEQNWLIQSNMDVSVFIQDLLKKWHIKNI